MKQKTMCSRFSDSLHYVSLRNPVTRDWNGEKVRTKPHRKLRRVVQEPNKEANEDGT
jgi:hypothetical protein